MKWAVLRLPGFIPCIALAQGNSPARHGFLSRRMKEVEWMARRRRRSDGPPGK